MALYTAEQLLSMMDGIDSESGSESEIEEDPAFPLPRPNSDDEDLLVPSPLGPPSESPSSIG